ncbi:MAG: lipoprotein-releasing ABC transporter permease subunit [Zoogloeaceae bacterium]|jgi:lipoprotein-releasing system permease protein|nr:lipoprotein-releasing ABC transporter permease subunit [Zoogloeaceae bacterium]
MLYEFFIGLTYTRARRRNGFISFLSASSILGVALGVAALIVVLSVMNGFQKELRERILGVVAHVQIVGMDGPLRQWQTAQAIAEKNPEVQGAAPFVEAQSMLSAGQEVRGAMVRGIVPAEENRVADFSAHMKSGKLEDLQPGAFHIVLGAELAGALGVRQGDTVMVIAPQGSLTPVGLMPRLKAFTVSGIFEAGMYEYDSGLALIALADAQKLYQTGTGVSGVRLKLQDLFAAPHVAKEVARAIDGLTDSWVTNWTRSHANFFRAVQIEKNMMFIILSIIVLVAAFNIVSTLVMTVSDKAADIAILRTLGARPRSILGIFMIQGALIGFFGVALGVAGGVALALNIDVVVPALERLLGIQFLARDVYYISELPSQLIWSDVVAIVIVAFSLTLLATVYPSIRAARMNPVEALRHE